MIFGAGLIGSTVVMLLRDRYSVDIQHVENSWDPETFSRQVPGAFARVSEEARKVQGSDSNPVSIEILWSAGAAGFHSTQEQVRREMLTFEHALDHVETLRIEHTVRAWLLSSVGGLFEGSRLISDATKVLPRRPYGELKLAQEQRLTQRLGADASRIIRLTSVYGYLRPGVRAGVVATLVANGVQQRVTTISGRMDTLRDYVWVEDLATRLIQQFHDDAPAMRSPAILASNIPRSLTQIRVIVERVLRRKVYISCALEANNAADMTVGRGSSIERLPPDALELNVRRIYADLTSREPLRPRDTAR